MYVESGIVQALKACETFKTACLPGQKPETEDQEKDQACMLSSCMCLSARVLFVLFYVLSLNVGFPSEYIAGISSLSTTGASEPFWTSPIEWSEIEIEDEVML